MATLNTRLGLVEKLAVEQLGAGAEVTPQDLADAQAFWAFWGTPLFRALLDAEPEPERDR
jgi:hypothetical protein